MLEIHHKDVILQGIRIFTLILTCCTVLACAQVQQQTAVSNQNPALDELLLSQVYQSAIDGDPKAQYELAVKIETGEFLPHFKPQEAFSWYLRSSEGKYGPAPLALGRIYEEGILVEQNVQAAIRYYIDALTLGQFEAVDKITNLSRHESLQVSVTEVSSEQAAEALMEHMLPMGEYETMTTYISSEKTDDLIRAAQAGDGQAAYRLAERYNSGRQADKDPVQACFWYLKAIKNGLADYHNEAFACLSEGLINDAQIKSADDLLTLIANINNDNVAGFVGEHYYVGHFVEQDLVVAYDYFTLADQQGDEYSQNFLGEFYRDGLLSAPDLEKAKYFFERSANGGLDVGMYNLAMLYINHAKTDSDLAIAFQWLQKSVAVNDFGDAAMELAKAHLYGKGTTPDITAAIKYFRLAKQQRVDGANCFLRALSLVQSTNKDTGKQGFELLSQC